MSPTPITVLMARRMSRSSFRERGFGRSAESVAEERPTLESPSMRFSTASLAVVSLLLSARADAAILPVGEMIRVSDGAGSENLALATAIRSDGAFLVAWTRISPYSNGYRQREAVAPPTTARLPRSDRSTSWRVTRIARSARLHSRTAAMSWAGRPTTATGTGAGARPDRRTGWSGVRVGRRPPEFFSFLRLFAWLRRRRIRRAVETHFTTGGGWIR